MADVENSTNQQLQRKYFVDAGTIFSHKKKVRTRRTGDFSNVFDSSQIRMSPTPVRPEPGKLPASDNIKVNVVKDGERITSIKIVCPCGRHAELDCKYTDEERHATDQASSTEA